MRSGRMPLLKSLQKCLDAATRRCTGCAGSWASSVKKTTLYQERDEEKRKEFQAVIEAINPEDIVYVDETGISPSLYRQYARAVRGKKVFFDVKGSKKQNVTIIAGLRNNQCIGAYAFEGYTDAKRFNGWLKTCLVPELKKGNVVVMDNYSIHNKAETREIIEAAGCRLIYQPAHSPDLNKIEQFWAKLKARIRNIRYKFDDIHDAIDDVFQLI